MQLLRPSLGFAATIALLVVTVSVTATQSAAHPPAEPDHGLDESTFYALWSGDTDADSGSIQDEDSGLTAMADLAQGTDIPFSSPPKAVEHWNRADLGDFPRTDETTSVYPATARTDGGVFIKNAHATIFAVQQSTRTRLSAGVQREYVAPRGHLLGTADYRIATPPNDTRGTRRAYWRLIDHGIEKTSLIVDGNTQKTAGGSKTPRFSYSLDRSGNDDHTLTLAANITATFWKRTEWCRAYDNDSNCIRWETAISYPSENISVSDSLDVRTYDLEVSGYRARYPNGDLGLVVYKSEPWSGYSLPDGNVHGVWRFYTARDNGWDNLVTRSEEGSEITHSPLHPLSVVAYPIRTGPTVAPSDRLTILETYGRQIDPPTLPSQINLDTLTTPYTASYGIATRVETTADISDVTAHGLVRGVSADASPESFAEIAIHRSNLSLAITETTEETATIQLTLRDEQTGQPISTADRDGTIILGGQSIETNETGTASQTFARSVGTVSARYDPGRWWHHGPSYVGDSDAIAIGGGILRFVSILFQLGVPVSLFCLAVFLIDRITSWHVWPFWRRL